MVPMKKKNKKKTTPETGGDLGRGAMRKLQFTGGGSTKSMKKTKQENDGNESPAGGGSGDERENEKIPTREKGEKQKQDSGDEDSRSEADEKSEISTSDGLREMWMNGKRVNFYGESEDRSLQQLSVGDYKGKGSFLTWLHNALHTHHPTNVRRLLLRHAREEDGWDFMSLLTEATTGKGEDYKGGGGYYNNYHGGKGKDGKGKGKDHGKKGDYQYGYNSNYKGGYQNKGGYSNSNYKGGYSSNFANSQPREYQNQSYYSHHEPDPSREYQTREYQPREYYRGQEPDPPRHKRARHSSSRKRGRDSRRRDSDRHGEKEKKQKKDPRVSFFTVPVESEQKQGIFMQIYMFVSTLFAWFFGMSSTCTSSTVADDDGGRGDFYFTEEVFHIAESDDKNIWVLDSASSKHITGHAGMISDSKAISVRFKTASAAEALATAKGRAESDSVSVKDVYHIPTLGKRNILSLYKMQEKGTKFDFDRMQMKVKDKKFKMYWDGGILKVKQFLDRVPKADTLGRVEVEIDNFELHSIGDLVTHVEMMHPESKKLFVFAKHDPDSRLKLRLLACYFGMKITILHANTKTGERQWIYASMDWDDPYVSNYEEPKMHAYPLFFSENQYSSTDLVYYNAASLRNFCNEYRQKVVELFRPTPAVVVFGETQMTDAKEGGMIPLLLELTQGLYAIKFYNSDVPGQAGMCAWMPATRDEDLKAYQHLCAEFGLVDCYRTLHPHGNARTHTAFGQKRYAGFKSRIDMALIPHTFMRDIVRAIDPSPNARKLCVDYCRQNSLMRLRTYAYPHHKTGGVQGATVRAWCSADTFFIGPNKEFAVLHMINLHSKCSKVKVLPKGRSPRGSDVRDFLEDCRGVGMLARNFMCDQGKEFDNDEVRDFLCLHKTTMWLVPKASWAQGSIERRHRTFRAVLERLYFIYGEKPSIMPQLILQACNAINMTPTSSLDGLSPFQIQFVQNPFDGEPLEPEAATQVEQVNARKPATVEDYKIRCDARAAYEKLKTDKIYIDQMNKLEEKARNFYPEADRVEVGDACDFYDKSLKCWLGPAYLIFKKENGNEENPAESVTFVIDYQGQFKRIHASHIRCHLTLNEMLFPSMLLKVARKTHGVEPEPDKGESNAFTLEPTRVEVVLDHQCCDVKLDEKQTDDFAEEAADDVPAEMEEEKDELMPDVDAKSDSDGGEEEKSHPDVEANADAVDAKKSDMPARVDGKFRLTKDYTAALYNSIRQREWEQMKKAKAPEPRMHWRDRKNAITQMMNLVKEQPEARDLKQNQIEKIAADISEEGEYCFNTTPPPKKPGGKDPGYDLSDPKWVAAIQKEIKAHEGVFREATDADLADYYPRKPIPCRLLLSIKRDGRHKARLVCMGFMAPWSPLSTFAGVPDMITIKMLIAIMATTGGRIRLLSSDATSAFLQAPYPAKAIIDLDSRIINLLGYKRKEGAAVKCMNGLPLSSKGRQVHRDAKLRDLGWTQNKQEPCVWMRGRDIEMPTAASYKQKMELQGSLQFLTTTRPDIVTALKFCSKAPAVSRTITALKRIIRYLRTKRVLRFKAANNKKASLVGFSDADWASFHNRHSNAGVTVLLSGCPVVTNSITQTSISTSVSEAEIYSMSECGKSLLRVYWFLESIQDWLNEYGIENTALPLELVNDNTAAIKVTSGAQGASAKLKHIQIRDLFVKDLIERELISASHCSSSENKANGLTKAATGDEFFRSLSQLSIVEI
eukprot:g2911.t1